MSNVEAFTHNFKQIFLYNPILFHIFLLLDGSDSLLKTANDMMRPKHIFFNGCSIHFWKYHSSWVYKQPNNLDAVNKLF